MVDPTFPLTDTPRRTPHPLATDRPLWERQPRENPKPWEAFQIYRDLGPTRSRKAAGEAVGKSLPLMNRWSVVHSWVKRAKAWDEFLEVQRREAAVKAVEDMATRHIGLATAAQNAVWLKLRSMGGPNGDDYSALPATVMASLLKVAVDMERISRGEVATRIGVDHSGDLKVSGLGRRIMDDPEATAAALELLDRLAGDDDLDEPGEEEDELDYLGDDEGE